MAEFRSAVQVMGKFVDTHIHLASYLVERISSCISTMGRHLYHYHCCRVLVFELSIYKVVMMISSPFELREFGVGVHHTSLLLFHLVACLFQMLGLGTPLA